MAAGLDILPDARAKRFANIFRDAPASVLRDCIFAWHPRMGTYATLGPKYGYQRLGGTFSNDSGGKNVYDRWAGLVRNFPSGVMPITGVQEPARTNWLLYSLDFSDSAWNKRGTAAYSAGQVDPRGGTAATRLTIDSGSNDIYQIFLGAATAGSPFGVGVWIKRVSTSGSFWIQNPADSALGRWVIDLSLLPDRWIRLTKDSPYVSVSSAFATNGSKVGGIHFAKLISDAVSFDVYNPQAEDGASYASSDILTTSAPVTCSADVFRFVNTSLFGGLSDEGSLLVVFKAPYASTILGNDYLLAALNASDSVNNSVGFITKGKTDWNLYAETKRSSVLEADVALDTYSASTWYAAAMAWKQDDMRAARNGVLGTAVTSADLPLGIDRLEIGAGSSGGTRQGLDYALVACSGRAWTDAELTALTLNPERYVGQSA